MVHSVSRIISSIDTTLQKRSPTQIICGSIITTLALSYLLKHFQKGWGQSTREQIGTWFLRFPLIRQKYREDMQKQLSLFKEEVREKWSQYPELITEIPEEGMQLEQLFGLIQAYSKPTVDGLKGRHFSGMIYSKSLDKGYQESSLGGYLSSDLDEKLRAVFTAAFEQSYLWNSLHGNEFAVGAYLDYQVVRMVASMFGGEKNEVMGFVTSGGTESLMLAVRSYREWGIKNRAHQPGQSVILVSKSVHAAILKAGGAYLVKIVLVDTDQNGRINLKSLQSAVKKHGSDIVAVVGSAPSYPTGVIDPIEDMAKIAHQNNFGFHVDCCLGGFIVNHLHKANYLEIPGVTSLSADTHKNGLAPKGSSVLVTKNLGIENLAYYSIYAVPDWRGGVYGTPKDAGSQSCVQSFHALLAMLAVGKKGYEKMAKAIHQATEKLAEAILEQREKLILIAPPEVNVVAFQIDPEWGVKEGAIYAVAHEMAKRGFTLSTMNDQRVHFCVTLRFAEDPEAIEKFIQALKDSLVIVESQNSEIEKFPGDAGMYGAIDAAISPNHQALSLAKYIENLLFGILGSKDAVRAYFLARLNPF